MNDYLLNITLAKGSGEYCVCKSLSLVPLIKGSLKKHQHTFWHPMHSREDHW